MFRDKEGRNYLFTNKALKFVDEGVTPHTRLWMENKPCSEGQPLLCCQDNGIGIAREFNFKVFAVFEWLEENHTGSGLAIVKKVVQRMNGSVGLDSDLGKGSCFWMELPGIDNQKGSE